MFTKLWQQDHMKSTCLNSIRSKQATKEYLSLLFIEKASYYFDLLATNSKGKAFDVGGALEEQFINMMGLVLGQNVRTNSKGKALDVGGALEEQFINMMGLVLGQNVRIKALAVENEKPTTSFAEAWASFYDDKFGLLKRFFGGLASVFPGTATVESNFLLINWEKDDYHAGLTDFCLEGILHSKQYFELLEVAHKMQLDQEEEEG